MHNNRKIIQQLKKIRGGIYDSLLDFILEGELSMNVIDQINELDPNFVKDDVLDLITLNISSASEESYEKVLHLAMLILESDKKDVKEMKETKEVKGTKESTIDSAILENIDAILKLMADASLQWETLSLMSDSKLMTFFEALFVIGRERRRGEKNDKEQFYSFCAHILQDSFVSFKKMTPERMKKKIERAQEEMNAFKREWNRTYEDAYSFDECQKKIKEDYAAFYALLSERIITFGQQNQINSLEEIDTFLSLLKGIGHEKDKEISVLQWQVKNLNQHQYFDNEIECKALQRSLNIPEKPHNIKLCFESIRELLDLYDTKRNLFFDLEKRVRNVELHDVNSVSLISELICGEETLFEKINVNLFKENVSLTLQRILELMTQIVNEEHMPFVSVQKQNKKEIENTIASLEELKSHGPLEEFKIEDKIKHSRKLYDISLRIDNDLNSLPKIIQNVIELICESVSISQRMEENQIDYEEDTQNMRDDYSDAKEEAKNLLQRSQRIIEKYTDTEISQNCVSLREMINDVMRELENAHCVCVDGLETLYGGWNIDFNWAQKSQESYAEARVQLNEIKHSLDTLEIKVLVLECNLEEIREEFGDLWSSPFLPMNRYVIAQQTFFQNMHIEMQHLYTKFEPLNDTRMLLKNHLQEDPIAHTLDAIHSFQDIFSVIEDPNSERLLTFKAYCVSKELASFDVDEIEMKIKIKLEELFNARFSLEDLLQSVLIADDILQLFGDEKHIQNMKRRVQEIIDSKHTLFMHKTEKEIDAIDDEIRQDLSQAHASFKSQFNLGIKCSVARDSEINHAKNVRSVLQEIKKHESEKIRLQCFKDYFVFYFLTLGEKDKLSGAYSQLMTNLSLQIQIKEGKQNDTMLCEEEWLFQSSFDFQFGCHFIPLEDIENKRHYGAPKKNCDESQKIFSSQELLKSSETIFDCEHWFYRVLDKSVPERRRKIVMEGKKNHGEEWQKMKEIMKREKDVAYREMDATSLRDTFIYILKNQSFTADYQPLQDFISQYTFNFDAELLALRCSIINDLCFVKDEPGLKQLFKNCIINNITLEDDKSYSLQAKLLGYNSQVQMLFKSYEEEYGRTPMKFMFEICSVPSRNKRGHIQVVTEFFPENGTKEQKNHLTKCQPYIQQLLRRMKQNYTPQKKSITNKVQNKYFDKVSFSGECIFEKLSNVLSAIDKFFAHSITHEELAKMIFD